MFLLQNQERISLQKIVMIPDILVCSTFIASFILAGNYERVRSYMGKRANK